MPIYEYRCPNGHTFEQFRRMSDPKPDGCEVCGEGPVDIVLYPVAVHYKGSGFYSTDYGRGSRKATKDGESSGGSEGGSDKSEGGSDKSDKKTEAKPEPKKAAEA